jgi:hypothetical protein
MSLVEQDEEREPGESINRLILVVLGRVRWKTKRAEVRSRKMVNKEELRVSDS